VNGTLLRPLAFRDPGKFIAIAEESGSLHYRGGLWVNAMHFLEWRKEARSFESLALVTLRFGNNLWRRGSACGRSGAGVLDTSSTNYASRPHSSAAL
jgi:hypothetical protein